MYVFLKFSIQLYSMPHIDPHVHCRDWKLAYKGATIKSVKQLAESQYVDVIFDMPNTNPTMNSLRLVEERLRLAKSEGCSDGYYVYIGATKNENQLREAAHVATTHPKVVGIKFFTTGKPEDVLAITDEKDQKKVYETLTECDYTGVIGVHCEKESLFRMNRWKPEKPWTWNLARPKEAEVEAVKDQIRFVKKTGFDGTLYIPHVSAVETVNVIDNARSSISIVCGVTPHHLTKSTLDMREAYGIFYKCNPPIRDMEKDGLKDCLIEGKIDWFETDHAPHSFREKTELPFMSGFPSLEYYHQTIELFRRWGLSKERIEDLTYNNIKRTFKKVIG